ncbi:hypothetical protein [Gordonia rhizosphera]|uniref:Uncharacterized protein n=1 Tax=Gordonia rhizosphera NBRC 16068 TaxID=1108045 RepID=K6W0L9_9ACTN|nr:hypothetical protein [Gordonia rhizosphera]GAB92715.1 hypothetical protein GORHZ_188_00060 [Gordonia rhizosphera NBRC 16068]
MSYAMPPERDSIKDMVNKRLNDARAADGERLTVEWQGSTRHLHVISMPTESLLYNPDTHRIRAQRSLKPDLDRELQSNPYSDKAQSYLDFLLKCLPSAPEKVDPDFIALRDNLEQFGQKDPGLITVDGMIVNANTRCAALRELHEPHIRVAVLPESSTWDDINEVELSLQLRKEFRRDYSYINQLLAVEEQLTRGRAPEDIARQFHIKTKTLEKDRWVFSTIMDAIERSHTANGSVLRLVDFEDHKEKLAELWRAYNKLSSTNPSAAEALKETRLALLILGFSKTDLRLAESNFYEDYLSSKLPENAIPKVEENKPSTVQIPGLPGVSLTSTTTATEQKTRKLADNLLQSAATARSKTATPDELTEASELLEATKSAVDRALEPAGRASRLQKRKLAAPERLSDAADDIMYCLKDLADARATNALDEDAFDDAALELRKALKALATQAARTFHEPGDGVTWLLAAPTAGGNTDGS